jgi:hypothetical protein
MALPQKKDRHKEAQNAQKSAMKFVALCLCG